MLLGSIFWLTATALLTVPLLATDLKVNLEAEAPDETTCVSPQTAVRGVAPTKVVTKQVFGSLADVSELGRSHDNE